MPGLTASAARAWAEPHHIRWQRFGLSDIGPVMLSQQLDGQLELVVQAQTADGVRDRRLVGDHLLHVFQSGPRRVWWQRARARTAHLESRWSTFAIGVPETLRTTGLSIAH